MVPAQVRHKPMAFDFGKERNCTIRVAKCLFSQDVAHIVQTNYSARSEKSSSTLLSFQDVDIHQHEPSVLGEKI